jgi:hypothetical protein
LKLDNRFRFHVIGGFDEREIPVDDLGDKITFYGYKQPDFLTDFYKDMDIFFSYNRPFKLFNGSFDGFPLGIDAAYCGVSLFVGDELHMNRHYTQGKDIVIVPGDAEEIAQEWLKYMLQPDMLHQLSINCQKTTQRLFDIDMQVSERMKVFAEFVTLNTEGAKK